MKILAISGSPRDNKTQYMIKKVLEKSADFAEIVKLSDLHIKPCTGCRACAKAPFECRQEDDMTRLSIKLRLAEVIILASPVYFDNVTGVMKNFFDRCLGLYWSKRLEDKKVILLAVAGGERQDSAERCLDSMQFWAKLLKMKVVARIGVANGKPEVKNHELEQLSNELLTWIE